MNTSDDLLLQERFSSIASTIDDSEWDEVVERAGLSPISRRSRIRQVRLLLAAGIVAFALGVGATIVYSVVVTWILLKVVDAAIGLRVTHEEEEQGLDWTQHGESGYNL